MQTSNRVFHVTIGLLLLSALCVRAQSPAGITNQPQSLTVEELKSASFSLAVTGSPNPVIQWFRNSAAIGGATSLTYSIATVQLTDNGAVFYATASNFVSGVSYMATSRDRKSVV